MTENQNKIKVVYILSNIEKAVAFEWIAEAFKENTNIELEFIILNDEFNTPLADYLKRAEVKLFQLKLGTKKNFPILWKKLYQLLRSRKADLVHTHLFEASLLGLSAAKWAGIKRRIYTRHHSTYHHEYFPKAIKYDKIINWLATDIVAISNNVREVLTNLEQVDERKITLINHGFKLEQFDNIPAERIKKMKDKYGIPEATPIIGCISRYLELKGIEYIIQAFAKLQKDSPDAHLVLCNASGPNEAVIRKELNKLDKHSYSEIQFESDLFSLYQVFDVYVHVPINSTIEAFGQTYVEALAAEIPSVFSLSGIAKDFIEDERNAIVVPPKDSSAIYSAISRILKDEPFKSQIVNQGKMDVERFSLKEMIHKLNELYT